MSSTRYVILHHRLTDGEHWDLMIEQPTALATWQLARNPLVSEDNTPIPATRIADHRKAYLEYEGPISRGRGEVARIEEGNCTIEEMSDAQWRFRLAGRHRRSAAVIEDALFRWAE